MQMDVVSIAGRTADKFFGMFSPEEKIFVPYLLTSLFLAWVVWRMETKKERDPSKKTLKSFLYYVFNPKIYKHKSSLQDYSIFCINCLLFYGLIMPLIVTQRPLAVVIRKELLAVFGPTDHPLFTGFSGIVLFTFVSALFYDLGAYWAHYLTHRLPALWAFHKVHHSAEVMNPITANRLHPVDLGLTVLVTALFLGVGLGVFSYFSHYEIDTVDVLGLNSVIFVYYLTGYNLRHTHIWLHYPRWMCHFLLSPAQHQIHHSVELKHRDKNLGLIFSFWDRIFGTLYVPKHREKFALGLTHNQPNPYRSMKEIYLRPITECLGVFHKRLKKKTRAMAFIEVTVMAVGLVVLTALYWELTTFTGGPLDDTAPSDKKIIHAAVSPVLSPEANKDRTPACQKCTTL